jgi:opacity protein-like surface antigen
MMTLLAKSGLFAAAMLAFLASADGGFAQSAIGGAETVERDVSGELEGRNRPVGIGDQVFQNEAISTADASAANLRFLDETALAIGPRARVILDRFIYNADRTARRGVIAAARGALRWTSGRSRANAYQIRTPLAAIGVRGTQFDLVVENGQETVILRDGRVRVCLTGTDLCRPLNNPGDVAYITPTAIDVAPRDAPSAQDFSNACLTGQEGQCRIDPNGPSIVSLAALPGLPTLGFTGFRLGLTTSVQRTRQITDWDGSASVQQSIGLGNVPARQSSASERVGFGIDVGYDFRNGPVIFGIGAELSGQPFGAATESVSVQSFTLPNFAAGQTIDVTVRSSAALNAAATIKGRLGVALTDDFIAYGVGGVSLGFTTESFLGDNSLAVTDQVYQGSRNRTRLGYVIGIGAEYRITPMISVMAEYNHFDYGRSTFVIPEAARGGAVPTGQFASPSTRINGDVFKTGLNFRF